MTFSQKKERSRHEEVYMEVFRNRDLATANNHVWNCKVSTRISATNSMDK